MKDNATTAGDPGEQLGPSLFATLAGLVCIVAGFGLAVQIEDAAGLRESLLAFRATTGAALYLPIALSLTIIFTSRPVGWGQRGLFALTVFLQSLAYYAAITIAGFAQTVIAPDSIYFVPLVVVMLFAWPVLAAGCLVFERGGIVARLNYRAIRRWTALAIPGMAACGLLADLMGAAGAMPVLIEERKIILLMAMAFPALHLAIKAQPTRPTHWALFGILLAVLQIVTVSVAMVTAWLVAPFTDGDSVFSMFMSHLVILPIILLPPALIFLARAATGPGGPWRPESPDENAETAA